MTKTEIEKGRKLTATFMGLKYKDGAIQHKPATKTRGAVFRYWNPSDNWNQLMVVVDKIEETIGHPIEMHHGCYIYFWYSPKKFVSLGNTDYKWKDPRTPFDSIGGKHHRINVSYPLESAEKLKARDKKEATFTACVKFIEWYNKTVKAKK